MIWTVVYLSCFALGVTMSLLAIFAGGAHLHGPHVSLGHGIGHGAGQGAGQGAGHGLGHGDAGARTVSQSAAFLNGFTVPAFLCWFGGERATC